MSKSFYNFKIQLILLILFTIGTVLVLVLSWKVNPNLGENELIPEWISDWTDQIENNRTRTGVPFIFLGIIAAIFLIQKKIKRVKNWLINWLTLLGILFLAEFGQYFSPTRIMDIEDIIWGGLGAAIGMIMTYSIKKFNELLNKYFGSKKH